MTQRVAIAGTGIRALGFAQALVGGAHPESELVGLYDLNRARMAGFCNLLARPVPSYTNLAELVARSRPQVLLVCTPDHTHASVIEQAYALGLDVITEKPLATDESSLGRILAAERRAGRSLRVAFNMRFMPFCRKIKALLAEGVIGRIRNVSVDWYIDRTHGIEYFRRWHGHMAQSGGLLVHKATHHFDLINWFVEDVPAQVSAVGSLDVFGSAGPFRGERCRDCAHASTCWAAMPQDWADPTRDAVDPSWSHLRKLYFDAEHEDGYLRDRCVFRPEIDIYDTMSVLIGYAGGTQVTYTLTAYSPIQGFALTFNGSDGRMEAKSISSATRSADMGQMERIRIYTGRTRSDVRMRVEDMPVHGGSHAGADEPMMRQFFGSAAERHGRDELGQLAGSLEGVRSALIGICANRSIAERRMVSVPDTAALAADTAGVTRPTTIESADVVAAASVKTTAVASVPRGNPFAAGLVQP